MTHSPKINYTMTQVDVMEKMNKTGDGSNLDDNFFDVYDLVYDIWYVETSRSRYLYTEYIFLSSYV